MTWAQMSDGATQARDASSTGCSVSDAAAVTGPSAHLAPAAGMIAAPCRLLNSCVLLLHRRRCAVGVLRSMVPVLDARSEYRINAVNAGRRTAMCSTRLQCSICHVMTATATVCATRTQDRHSHTARSATACAAMLILSSDGRIYYAMLVHCGCRKLLICHRDVARRARRPCPKLFSARSHAISWAFCKKQNHRIWRSHGCLMDLQN